MPTTPWTAAEIANAKSGKTAIDFRIDRGPSVNPIPFCCGSNTISVSKDPTCLFATSPEIGTPDTVFSVDAAASFSPDNSIVSWDWDFGDGQTASGSTAQHQYSVEGDYEIVLTIEDLLGAIRNCAKGVTIHEFELPLLPLDAGNRIWVGGTGRAWYTLDFGIDKGATVPVWVDNSAGLPAGARVNDLRVDPQTPSIAYAACGSPTHALNGGLRRISNWVTGTWQSITPSKPDQWRDPQWVGTEVTRYNVASLIALSAAEWNKANWLIVRPSFRYGGNVLAFCEVEKEVGGIGTGTYGTFAAYYRADIDTWELEQLWLNDTQPWWARPLQADVSLASCRYIWVTLQGRAPATNTYKIQYNVNYGQSGAWFTSQISFGGTNYKPSGAVWAIHDWTEWSETNQGQAAITVSPWVAEATVDASDTPATSYTVGADGNWTLRGAPAGARLSQGFQVSERQHIDSVELYLLKVGTPSGDIWVEIQTDSGGIPSNTLVAYGRAKSALVEASSVSDADYEWISFVFEPGIEVEGSTQYHLVLQGDYSEDPADNIRWGRNSAAGYANGTPATYDSGTETWTAQGNDNLFRVFGLEVTWADSEPDIPNWIHASEHLGLWDCYNETYPVRGWHSWEFKDDGVTLRHAGRWFLYGGPLGSISYVPSGVWSQFLCYVSEAEPVSFPSACCANRWTHATLPDLCEPGRARLEMSMFTPMLAYNVVATDEPQPYCVFYAPSWEISWKEQAPGDPPCTGFFVSEYRSEYVLGVHPGVNTNAPLTALQAMLHRTKVIVGLDPPSGIRLGLRDKKEFGGHPLYRGWRFEIPWGAWYRSSVLESLDVGFEIHHFSGNVGSRLDADAVDLITCYTGAQIKVSYPCPTLGDALRGFLATPGDEQAKTFYDKTGAIAESIYSIGINHFES